MWVIIAGPDGSGKKVIADWFVREFYELRTVSLSTNKNDFMREDENRAIRLARDLECAQDSSNKDIVTIRSYWDTFHVHAKMMRKFEEINTAELDHFQSTYNLFGLLLPAPTAFIYCKIDVRSALERAALKGQTIEQDRLRAQIELYEKFFEKVAVPVVELEMSKDIGHIFKDLEFGMASLKSVRLDGRSIWKRAAVNDI